MEPEDQEKEIEMEQEPIKVYKGGAVNSVNGKTGDVVLTTSDLENDSDYQTGSEVDSAIDSAIGELNIPTKTSDLENDGEDGSSVYVEADELASVATSGSYNDLENKPTIPTVNDATLTITQNGTSKGTFTANDADDTTIEVSDTTYTAGTGIDITNGVISATGGGDTVYSTKTTSNNSDGGAVYIGPLNANQEELPDQTTTDNHYRYFWALPFDTSGQNDFGIPKNETINIGGQQRAGSQGDISIGYRSQVQSGNSVVIGAQAWGRGEGYNIAIGPSSAIYGGACSIAIGRQAETSSNGSIALGAFSRTSRVGELYIGTSRTGYGFNNTAYRVIGGVHDGQLANDAVTVNQVNSVIDAINTALSTNIPHIGA